MSLGPLMVDIAGVELTAEDREVLRHPLVGSVILFTRNYADPAQLAALTASIHALRDPPLIIAVDHEGGRVQRFRDQFTLLPPARLIGHQYDMDRREGLKLAQSCAWLLGAELRAAGVDLSFTPVVDLDYSISEVIGDRSFHRDPAVVAALAGATMSGLKETGMAAVAKHFPGHGAVIADSHVSLPVDKRELFDLEPDLQPYRQLIANGLPGIMVAHVVFPEFDSAPASMSARWIEGFLRGELEFHGVVFADDLSMGAAAAGGDVVERVWRAHAAGCDVLPVCNDRGAVHKVLGALTPDEMMNPASQARLMRLHGRGAALSRAELLVSDRWRETNELIRRASQPPPLKLDSEQA